MFRSVWLHCTFRAHQLAQLLDKYPAMCRWIREVHIRYPSPAFDFWEIFTADSPLKLDRLVNLHALYFECLKSYRRGSAVPWILPPSEDTVVQFTEGLRKLTTVRELHILKSLVDMSLLSCLLGCLPSLHSISMLGDIQRDSHYEKMAAFSFSHEQLTHVHLDTVPSCHLMFPLLPGVREIRLDCRHRITNYADWGESISSPATHSTSLTLCAAVIDNWDLEHLRCVKTFILEPVFSQGGDCLKALRRLQELPIEDLIVKGSFSHPRKIKHFGCLEANLAFPGFLSLKRIRFIHQGDFSAEVIERKLREALPVLQTREVALEVIKVKDVRAYKLHE